MEDFEMPFGKYEGETLETIYVADKQYLIWAKNNLEGDVGDTIREFMEDKKVRSE